MFSENVKLTTKIDLRVPIRDKTNKFYVPVEKYPGDYYPLYPAGGAYLMSNEMVFFLLGMAEEHEDLILPLEDVYNGLVRAFLYFLI
jgi:hypothetical protein